MSDGKELAKKEVMRRDVQADLRQFLKMESGGLGRSKAFREWWDMAHSPDRVLSQPLHCSSPDCPYVAETRKDVEWHIKQCPDHLFWLPGKER